MNLRDRRAAASRIIAPFNGPARQEIHFTAKELLQFILHGKKVKPGPYPRTKSNHQVQIAARPRFARRHGAKHLDSRNAVAPAKRGKALSQIVDRGWNCRARHSIALYTQHNARDS